MPSSFLARRGMLLIAIGAEGALAGIAWFLGWLSGNPCYATIHWNIADLGWGFAAAGPMLVGFVVCLVWPIPPLVRIKRFSREVIPVLFASCTIPELLIISVVAGVAEELLFRGVLQAIFAYWLGSYVGLVLASALFGLAHLITATYAILAALVGIYLGGVWLWSGNLLVPIVAHAVYDFVVLLVLVKGLKRSSEINAPENAPSVC